MLPEKKLKLLISNDDGIFALGVRTLANALAQAGHEVTVVCPRPRTFCHGTWTYFTSTPFEQNK